MSLQNGAYYLQLADRLFHALEWRYNKITDADTSEEIEILGKILDCLMMDSVNRDLSLKQLENAMRAFKKVRDDAFQDGLYDDVLEALGLEWQQGEAYMPQLYGVFHHEMIQNA